MAGLVTDSIQVATAAQGVAPRTRRIWRAGGRSCWPTRRNVPSACGLSRPRNDVGPRRARWAASGHQARPHQALLASCTYRLQRRRTKLKRRHSVRSTTMLRATMQCLHCRRLRRRPPKRLRAVEIIVRTPGGETRHPRWRHVSLPRFSAATWTTAIAIRTATRAGTDADDDTGRRRHRHAGPGRRPNGETQKQRARAVCVLPAEMSQYAQPRFSGRAKPLRAAADRRGMDAGAAGGAEMD